MALTVAAGQIILADHHNNLVPLKAIKSADQTLTSNSTALQNVTELVLAMEVSTVYDLDCMLFYDTLTTADIKWGFTFPAGTTISWAPAGLKFDGTNFESHFTAVYQQAGDTTTPVAGLGAGTPVGVRLKGTVRCGATPGNLQLRAAQQTAVVGNTIVKADSSMELRKT